MRILHILHQYVPETWGGVEVYVRDVAAVQTRAGHDVRILAGTMAARPEVVTAESVHDGIPVTRIHRFDLFFDSWDKGYCPAVADLVRRLFSEWRPDLVHVHHWIRLTNDLAAIARAMGIPVVLTLHDFALSCPRCFRMRPDESPCFRDLSVASCLDCVPRRPWQDDREIRADIEMFRKNSRTEIQSADAVISATTMLKDLVTRALDLPADRFHVLPLAYSPRFRGLERKADPAVFRFAYWGSITHRKGVPLLIEALRRLVARRRPDAHPVALDVFGAFDLPEREAAIRAAAEGLPVVFHGRFEHANLASAGLAAAVFPSLCIETYGIVMDEALELGLPVIVPNIGAMADRAGSRAVVFRVNDADALADALLQVLDRGPVPAAREIEATGALSEEAHAERLEAIYQSAVRDRRPAVASPITANERSAHLFKKAESLFARLIATEGPDVSP